MDNRENVEAIRDAFNRGYENGRKQERKAIQDFYQTKEGDILIPKEDWQAIEGVKE